MADQPELSFVAFSQDQVRMLGDYDFTLDNENEKVYLRGSELAGCVLILFHVNNSESRSMASIWNTVASQVVGPLFAAVNLTLSRRVSRAFTELASTNGPLRWARMKQLPSILIYQGRKPVGAYNGTRSVQALADFALSRACDSDYREPGQLFSGVRVDEDEALQGVQQTEIPSLSAEFTSENPLRPASGTVEE